MLNKKEMNTNRKMNLVLVKKSELMSNYRDDLEEAMCL